MASDIDRSSLVRLHTFLARAGKGSRRAMETAIQAGRVSVDGKPVTIPGSKIDPSLNTVTLDDVPVHTDPNKREYIAVNKPAGVLTTTRDERDRRTILNILPTQFRTLRIYPAGRLDRNSEGLVLLTNDGQLTYQLTHPSFEHEREYVVRINGHPTREAMTLLQSGIELEDGPTRPAKFDILDTTPQSTEIRIVLKEGRNRQIRRMFAAVDHAVLRLTRTRIATLHLGSLQLGHSRRLSYAEVAALCALKVSEECGPISG